MAMRTINPPVPPSEYIITTRNATHLIFECRLDKPLWKRAVTSCFFVPFMIMLVFILPMFSLVPVRAHASFNMVLVAVVAFVPLMLVLGRNMRDLLVKSTIIELDKISNVFRVHMPGALVRHPSLYDWQARWAGRVSTSWDLQACTFRLVAPGESIGFLLSMMRFVCRDRFLVVMQPAPGATPVPLLATASVERASAMIDEMQRFKRGAVHVDSPEHDTPPSGRPATAGREPPPPAGDIIACTFCGARNNASIRFCSRCGGELGGLVD